MNSKYSGLENIQAYKGVKKMHEIYMFSLQVDRLLCLPGVSMSFLSI